MRQLVFGVSILMCLATIADMPTLNERATTYSRNRAYYVVMNANGGSGGFGKGKGKAYRRKKYGRELLWGVDFYARRVILTNDGRKLIAFGPWAKNVSELALAFYQDGVLRKAYRISDLVKDQSKLQRTISHFTWQKYQRKGDGLSKDEKTYRLSLVDGSVYVFEVSTGRILAR